MKGLASWFARNPVAANLLMFALFFGGYFGLQSTKVEMFPEFSLDSVTVQVPYPGAAPQEIEEGICVKIEEEVHSIEGVDEVTSTAVEGMGTVMVQLKSGADPRRVLDDVKTRVDAISTFPEEAEEPIIQEVLLRRQVINVALYGDVPERTLKELGETVRDEVNEIEGISQVELAATRPYEIAIEVSERALRAHGLTFDAVANAVRSASVDLSGGSLKTRGGEILLRSDSQAYRGEEYEEIVVLRNEDGTRVALRDVASVVDGFEDTDQASRFNGAPTVMVQVFRIGDESALDISAAVKTYVDDLALRLPDGVSVDTWQDQALWLQSRMDLLIKNGIQGGILVFLVLALFLRFRLSFWVSLGIPICFLGTFMVMPWLDQSLNMLTLFAFLLVLGIVVDDAIVVGESIFSSQEQGNHGVEGADRGIRAVAVPVVFAILTTIAAFLPIVFLPTVTGKFFAVIPLVVIPALVFSLVESQLILPAHLAHEGGWMSRLSKYAPFSWWVAFQGLFARGLAWFARRVYQPSLELALGWRYTTVAVAIATMLITFGAVQAGWMKFVFFPSIEGDVIAAQVTMPKGTSVTVTRGAVQQIEDAAAEMIAQVEAETGPGSIVMNYMASVGEQPYLSQKQQTFGSGDIVGPEVGEVTIELTPAEGRTVSANELNELWQELAGPIAGAVEVNFDSALISNGDPIDLQLSGRDIDVLKAAAEEVKAELARFDGVREITDSFRGGKQELVLEVLPQAEALGITQLDLARQVRQGFYGEEAQRIQRGRDDVRVMVRYPESVRESLYAVEEMRVRTPAGVEVPFSEVASVRPQRGFSTIQRNDRARTIHVTADVDLSVADPKDVIAALEDEFLPAMLGRYQGVSASFEGQSSDQAEFGQAMVDYYVLSLFAIFALMAIPFRSYLQPLIIMTAIPFGVVGAVWGHIILGLDFSTLSVMGVAALAGVVVNDSLVLVDYVNKQRDAGMPLFEAARSAGAARFRPILLTSLTTFFGLTPLILEKSVQAQFLIPMCVSLAFGVLFSTFVTLVLVPSLYLILDDVTRSFRWLYPALFTSAETSTAARPEVSGA